MLLNLKATSICLEIICLCQLINKSLCSIRQPLLYYLSENASHDWFQYALYSDNLFPTSGATNGLYMLASQYFRPGDLVFVEELSFLMAVKMLSKDLRMQAIPGK